VAVGRQYRYHYHYIPYGLPYSKYAESRRKGDSSQLDEIIRAIEMAQNEMIDIEHLSDDELAKLSQKFETIRRECESRRVTSRT
jgi:hypothetical protein